MLVIYRLEQVTHIVCFNQHIYIQAKFCILTYYIFIITCIRLCPSQLFPYNKVPLGTYPIQKHYIHNHCALSKFSNLLLISL